MEGSEVQGRTVRWPCLENGILSEHSTSSDEQPQTLVKGTSGQSGEKVNVIEDKGVRDFKM